MSGRSLVGLVKITRAQSHVALVTLLRQRGAHSPLSLWDEEGECGIYWITVGQLGRWQDTNARNQQQKKTSDESVAVTLAGFFSPCKHVGQRGTIGEVGLGLGLGN
ncbi:unnamed protein product, partial [Ectocarpus sp. 12 AP-2014]